VINETIIILYIIHRGTLYSQKLALTSPTSGGRSVGIVRLWTQATELSYPSSSFLFKTGRFGDWILLLYFYSLFFTVGPNWRSCFLLWVSGDRLALSVVSNWVDSTWRRRANLVSEASCFKYKTRRWIMSRNGIVTAYFLTDSLFW
jgi:hypothetical protein